ncbi:MAG: OprO/OprP family phosphate-selective porin, partial [Duncaniella sp.]|nr:OprO/OprP family phosphate-selective porin [Duncaniella sp.]
MRNLLMFFGIATALCAQAADVETDELMKFQAEVRLDYQRDWNDGEVVKDNTGFEGKYINFRIDGKITDGLTYSWRQRLNKTHKDATFFDATDWVYLNYDFGRWSVAGGKQVVAIGGWEYDRAPIDLYSCSVFWNNIPCYQIGGSVSYRTSSADKLTFQLCESPFHSTADRDMYAYNLMWNSHHGIFDAIWSANLIEYAPGRYINYLALGNKFTVRKVSLELDLMNRAASHQTFLLRDVSVMGELSYVPTPRWKVFGKMTYDVNHTNTSADLCVAPGTELKMAGAGVEFFPLVNKLGSLRLHANIFYSWGKNANGADVMQNKTMIVDCGVKWNMNLLSIKR